MVGADHEKIQTQTFDFLGKIRKNEELKDQKKRK